MTQDTIKTPAWLEELYAIVKEGGRRDGGDLIYDRMDTLLGDSQFEQADAVLSAVDLDRLDAFTMVGFLTITGAARDLLPSRSVLYRQIRERLTILHPDRVERILVGLE